MEELQNRLAGLFGRAPGRGKNGEQESITVAEGAPLVDITEDDREYLIKAELPEVKKDPSRNDEQQSIAKSANSPAWNGGLWKQTRPRQPNRRLARQTQWHFMAKVLGIDLGTTNSWLAV